jgi:hypothetical protein
MLAGGVIPSRSTSFFLTKGAGSMIKKADQIMGVFLRILLSFLCIFLLFAIAMHFLAEAEIIHGTEIVKIDTYN